MTLYDALVAKIDEKTDRMIELRRHMHQYPELSFEEEKTGQFIVDFYDGKDHDGIETQVGGMHGSVVTIKGAGQGPTIALRADFDALPIQEDTGLPFASKVDGVMHACGHDGHTAYMLILAESLIELKDQINGTVKIVHQPAEEVSPGGAKTILESGVLDDVDTMFGIHVMTNAETGKVQVRGGNVQTGRSNFSMTVKGKSGHGSSPHQANDAIVAAAAFVTNVQSMISRRIDPFDMATFTIGNFDGTGQANVINDHVQLDGDVRTMSQEASDTIMEYMTHYAEGIAEMYQVDVDLNYVNDYPVLHNDEEAAGRVRKALDQMDVEGVTVEESPLQAPSEDFAFYAEKIPSVFFYVGCTPKGQEAWPHHHPKFFVDEKSLPIAAKSMAAVVQEYVG